MKYLLSQRYLLTTFFLTLFQMGGPFVVVAIASRFARNVYWRARQVAVVPIISYQRAFYNVFSYLQEISVLNAALVVFSYRSVNDMMFLDNNLFKYWSNFFISGMEARFANFFNWSNIMMRDRQRSPNKKRFNADIWSVHYKSVGEWQKNRDLAGIILHRYFFRRAVGLPKIIVSKFAVRRDFFLPVPAVATELVLFSFLYLLLRIYFFYRTTVMANRLFWDTRFIVYENRSTLAFSRDTFRFAFNLYGRRYNSMRLWEYTSYIDAFHYLNTLKDEAMAEEHKYDL